MSAPASQGEVFRPDTKPVAWARELQCAAQSFGGLVCVSDGTRELSYRELADRAGGLAARLRAAGVQFGTPVAIFLRNSIEAVWATYGAKIAGAAVMPLNADLSEDERRYCIALTRARHVVTAAMQRPFFDTIGVTTIAVEDVLGDSKILAELPPVPARAWGHIGFTSGTTGRPKAIVHTHEARWVGNLLQRASLPMTARPGRKVLLMTPFSHGASLITFAYLDHGAAVVLLDGVDLPVVERLLTGRLVDQIFAPPTVLAKLAQAFEGRHFSGIDTVFCGTSTLTPALYDKARRLFGPVVRVTYGKSEIVNPITVLPPEACDLYYGEDGSQEGACVGWPASGVEVDIVGDDGQRLATDEIGEVHLRAQHMLCGHIDAGGFHPVEPDGWHATGDLGRVDAAGRLHLVGRIGDVIKSGGYKIYPEEIERVLAPCASALVVVTLPSPYWGEVIIAVAEAPSQDWEQRARQALTALAKYKHPRAFVAVADLPRNPQGKIPRADVRAKVLADWQLVDGARPSLVRRRER